MTNRVAVADRPDGLGARLCAIFNALLVSEITGCHFAFTWPETYVNTDNFHAVPEVGHVFSDAFVKLHYLSPSSISHLSPTPLLLPNKMPVEQAQHYFNSHLQEYNISLPWNQLLRRLAVSPEERRHLVLSVTSRMQLSDELAEVRRRAASLAFPRRSTAIHLRAGDIVYGRFAENPNFAGKTIPAPLAKLIIDEDQSDACFVLFGQEPEFASMLAAKGIALDGAQILPDLNSSPISWALKDVFLMARCGGYYAGSSGFIAFAENIGNCRPVRWDRKRSKSAWARLIMEEVNKGLGIYYSDQQAAFACFFSYTCLGQLEVKDRLKALSMARGLCPTNRLYALLFALNLYDQASWAPAEKALSELSAKLDQSKDALLASREMLRLCKSRTGSGKNPYAPHILGLESAVRHGCPSAQVLHTMIATA